MPSISSHTASESIVMDGLEVQLENFEGGYTVCFESHTGDLDMAPLFQGLPEGRCQFPRWGYVLVGRVEFRFADHAEVYQAGEAYYVPPGHTPIHHAGSRLVEFSPTDLLGVAIGVVMSNLDTADVGSGRPKTPPETRGTDSDSDQDVASADAWGQIAAGYGEFVAPGEAGFATAALDLVGLTRHESFLDVAAGTGGLSLPAARRGARVLATDWAPEMISQFQARVRAEGLDHATGRVMDAHALDLDDDTFDVTGSQFGVMLLPDQDTALREMVRVTKPGGRVLLVVLGPPADFEALQFFIEALRSVVPGFHGLPDDPPPLEFQVSDPDVLEARLKAAGLEAVELDCTHLERLEFRTGRDCWTWIVNSNPIVGSILEDVPAADQARVLDALEQLINERRRGGDVAVLTSKLNIGWGSKPTSA